MNWSSVQSAERYEVNVEYESNGSWYNEGTYTVYSNNYTKYFGYNNEYRMRVRAMFSGGNSTNWSGYRYFTVGTSGSYSTTAPTIYSPMNYQSYSVGNYVTIGWYAPSYSTGISNYEVAIEYQSGSNWYAEGTYSTTNLSYQKYFGSSNSYRVRVRAIHSDSSYTSWSDYRYFTVGTSQSTSGPSIYAPVENQNFPIYSSVNVNWYTLSNVYRYEVSFEYQSGGNWYTEGTYTTSNLTYSKYLSQNNNYRVRVRAQFNDYTYSNWSGYRYFSVGTQQTIYDVPTISNPTTNQVFSNGSVAVDWNDVSMALRYEMIVEYQSSGNWYTETSYTNLTSSYQQLSLFYHTNYRIKVRAIFVQDEGTWSEYRYFSVQ